jgi:septal ring factor EnvC (AmiA/AmiB activator)
VPTLRRVHALIIALLLPGALCGAEPDPAARQRELDRIHQRVEALNRSMQEDRLQQDSLARELRETEQSIASLTRALRNLEKESDAQEQRVGQTRQQRAVVQRQLESERGALRQQVRAAYLMGRQQQTKLLLNQEDPGRLGRVLTYYDYLNRARVRQIEAIRAQLERLRAVERTLQTQLDQLNLLQEERGNTLNQLKQQRDQRRSTLDQLATRIKDQKREIARLREDEARLQNLMSGVRKALADLPYERGGDKPFPTLRGARCSRVSAHPRPAGNCPGAASGSARRPAPRSRRWHAGAWSTSAGCIATA